jgi:predicted molibdopterin-dependent oxidoreductase YjgC
LAEFASLHLRPRPGTDVAVLNSMAHIILAEGLEDQSFIAQRTEGIAAFKESAREWAPERAAEISGVPAEQITEAARLYARAGAAAIFWAMGITQHTHGTDNVAALVNLALLCGQVGRPGTGLNPLWGQNNVLGACDMGCLPDAFPGYQPVTSEGVRRQFAAGWGVPFERLREGPGLTITEMIDAALEAKVRALFILGENPMLSYPNLHHIEQALGRLDFLVIQDIFPNETSLLADVVLPGAGFAEKAGTFTNTERRVQLVRPAIDPPGEARQDWAILSDLACRLGAAWSYGSPSEIFDEMAHLTPLYGGMSHERLESGGLQWPCPSPDHPGTPILHAQEFPRGRGLFSPVHYAPAAEAPDREFPLILSTGRVLFHWHGGTLSRRSPGLDSLAPAAEVEIHPEDAMRLNIHDRQRVRVRSRRGEVVAVARLTRRSPTGTVFMTFHYAEAAANLLTADAIDPVAKIPEYKVAAVSVEPVREPAGTFGA